MNGAASKRVSSGASGGSIGGASLECTHYMYTMITTSLDYQLLIECVNGAGLTDIQLRRAKRACVKRTRNTNTGLHHEAQRWRYTSTSSLLTYDVKRAPRHKRCTRN